MRNTARPPVHPPLPPPKKVHGDPKLNFDNFFWSALQCFLVVTGEGWNGIMYYVMAETSPIASLYFVMIIVVGNFWMLNLILAVILAVAAEHMADAFRMQEFRRVVAKVRCSCCWHRRRCRPPVTNPPPSLSLSP